MATYREFGVGVRCVNCAGTSIFEISDPDEFDDDRVWACPHCSGVGGVDARPIRTYDVMGFKAVDGGFDPADSIDDYEHDDGFMSPTMRADFEAVDIRGSTGAARARDRGVKRGTVTKTVARARRKIRAATS